MILCGFCGRAVEAYVRCSTCGHYPEVAWEQRGEIPPVVEKPVAGRPALDLDDIRRRLTAATNSLQSEGRQATVGALAERLDVSDKTIRRWREALG